MIAARQKLLMELFGEPYPNSIPMDEAGFRIIEKMNTLLDEDIFPDGNILEKTIIENFILGENPH